MVEQEETGDTISPDCHSTTLTVEEDPEPAQ